jgi:hypothetical protein
MGIIRTGGGRFYWPVEQAGKKAKKKRPRRTGA